jgi:hypothetical protein
MYSTQVYIFQQMTRVLMMDTSGGETFIYRYDPVYAKRLTINKGVDNVILFEFVNQEEKPVNITGSSFVFRLIDQQGTKLLIDEPLVILNGPTGRAKVTLSAEQLLELQAQPANYSLVRTQPMGGLTEAVFTNAQAGARAPVDVVNSVMPAFVPSSELTIPTLELTSQLQYGGTSYGQYPGGVYWQGNPNGGSYYNSWANTEYYSSFIAPRGPVTTIQMDLIQYTGTIKAQWAENYESLWYNATESTTYLNETRTIHLNVIGWYPLLRLAFNNSVFSTPINYPGYPAIAVAYCVDGVLDNIQVLNGGQGYLAPPRIDIIGNGAGATAEAEISGTGQVIGITVTNGGSGYWPMPNNPNPGASPSPVPASQQGAIVVISTGFVVNLMYR